MPTRSLPIPEGLGGLRVDVGVAKLLGLSRSLVQASVARGDVMVDGAVAHKSDRLEGGMFLEITWEDPHAAVVRPEPIADMNIVFEDDDIVVVDKPIGVAAHPAVSWHGPTVLGGLAAAGVRVATSGAAERAGIVQRLDVGTSGLMVVAKSEIAYSRLKRAFKERTVDKTYHAVVQGQLDPLSGTIDAPIGRHPKSDWKFGVVSGGRRAVTQYTTLEAFHYGSLVEVHLETGRTHQIRVHLSANRHPLIGDMLYGADPTLAERLGLTRQWLHAVTLSFEHPVSGERVTFHSEYPEDLAKSLALLRED